MKRICKGTEATSDGVILSEKEYYEYKKLKEIVATFRSYKKDYNSVYKSCYM